MLGAQQIGKEKGECCELRVLHVWSLTGSFRQDGHGRALLVFVFAGIQPLHSPQSIEGRSICGIPPGSDVIVRRGDAFPTDAPKASTPSVAQGHGTTQHEGAHHVCFQSSRNFHHTASHVATRLRKAQRLCARAPSTSAHETML